MPKIIKNLEILLFPKKYIFWRKNCYNSRIWIFCTFLAQKLQTFHLNILTKNKQKIFWAQKVIFFFNLNFSRQNSKTRIEFFDKAEKSIFLAWKLLQLTKTNFFHSFSGAYSGVTYDDKTSENFCEKVPFSMAFGILIAFWVMLPLLCCCGAMACCCKMFANCKKEENPA